MRRYFAYGSNMDATQMLERCPLSKKVGTSALVGHEFFINKRGVANIRPVADKKVYGVVYEITDDAEKTLDCFEGVQFGTNTQVQLVALDAFCYIAKETEEGHSPREGYLEKIIKAVQDNEFPQEYVTELESWKK